MESNEHLHIDAWETAQSEIRKFIEYVLLRIEMHYGSNRAPIVWPPQFRQDKTADGTAAYSCIIQPDETDEPPLIYTDADPAVLLPRIQADLIRLYNPPLDIE